MPPKKKEKRRETKKRAAGRRRVRRRLGGEIRRLLFVRREEGTARRAKLQRADAFLESRRAPDSSLGELLALFVPFQLLFRRAPSRSRGRLVPPSRQTLLTPWRRRRRRDRRGDFRSGTSSSRRRPACRLLDRAEPRPNLASSTRRGIPRQTARAQQGRRLSLLSRAHVRSPCPPGSSSRSSPCSRRCGGYGVPPAPPPPPSRVFLAFPHLREACTRGLFDGAASAAACFSTFSAASLACDLRYSLHEVRAP